MGILDSLARLDDKVGIRAAFPRRGQSQRDFLANAARSRRSGYVPQAVYRELVELHDKVAALEVQLTRLQADR